MKEEILVWLHDIKKEILTVEHYYSSTGGKSFSEFSRNKMLKRATERSFEIIGEAVKEFWQRMNKLLSEMPEKL